MNYRSFLLFTIYSVTLTGWGAVWIGERLNPAFMILTPLAMVVGIYSDLRGQHILRRSWNSYLLFLGLTLAIWDWRLGSQVWFLSVIYLLIYVTNIRILSAKANRDLAQMISLAFLQLLAASVITSSASYALFFLSFFFLAPWALLAITTKAESEEEFDLLRGEVATDGELMDSKIGQRVLTREVLMTMTFAIAITVFVTFGFFLAFPRFGTGGLVGRLALNQPVAGLSEEVKLGAMGNILQDSSPALRIQLERGKRFASDDLYVRAIALNEFDGQRWRNQVPEHVIYKKNGNFALPGNPPTPTHRLNMLVEELGTDLLPVVPRAKYLYLEKNHLISDAQGALRNHGHKGPLKYQIESAPQNYVIDVDWSTLDVPEWADDVRDVYMKLPETDLPLEVTAVPQGGTLAWVPDMLDIFRSFSYTLGLPDADRPLFDFFARRAGHCELFATSLALMLRHAGMPAVVVNGFRGGEWIEDDDGGYYLVRQRNAHSWVEVYHPSIGWFPVDPTPPSPSVTSNWKRFQEAWQRSLDRFRFFWLDRVVEYDIQTQTTMVSTARKKTQNFGERLRTWSKDLLKTYNLGSHLIIWTLTVVIATVVMVLLYWLSRFRRGRRRVKLRRIVLERWLQKLLRDLEKEHGPRPDGMPVVIWASELELTTNIRRALFDFLDRYQRWRYDEGGHDRALRRRARELRALIKRKH